MLLLCGVIAILGLCQGGEAYKCSSRADSSSASFWKDYLTVVSACPPDNSSGTCTPKVAVVLRYDSLESWRAIVYVLIDLAPLMVYLPLLILFNAVIMLLLFIICNGASIATSIEAPFGGLFNSSASTTIFRQQQSVNGTSTMVLYRMVVSSMALRQQCCLAQRQACLGSCAMCIT